MLLTEKISIFLAIFSMLALFVIIVRKFSVLSILNTDNIPGEKEASFKKEIIKKRVNRDLSKIFNFIPFIERHVKKNSKNALAYLEKSLNKLKEKYLKKRFISAEEKLKAIKDLFQEAESLEKKESYDLAEQKLLEVINLEQNNLKAFFYLGKIYFELNKFTEAIQTLKHSLKLATKEKKEGVLEMEVSIAEIYFSLAGVAKEMEKYEYSLESIKSALDLEPNNPRYLDLVIDLSIMKKDKNLASAYLLKMSEINPENNKLFIWEERIMNLSENLDEK